MDKAACSIWIQREVRARVRGAFARSFFMPLLAMPLFVVQYAFVLAWFLYYFMLAIALDYHPELWALLALVMLWGAYFLFFRIPSIGNLKIHRETDTGAAVFSIPNHARDYERTTLRFARPGYATLAFQAIFAGAILLEDAWRALGMIRQMRRINVGLCAEVVAHITGHDGPVKLKDLEESFDAATLEVALPQLWQLDALRFDTGDPQTVEIARIDRDEILILSVA